MKNQYFGDVNDYRKYGLLRTLLGPTDLTLDVAWMLTSNDNRSDGDKTGYLNKPDAFRGYDPDLFDFLRDTVIEQGRREVKAIEATDLLPNARYHSAKLTSDTESRSQYFESLTDRALSQSLVFFDPDNGLEVTSTRKGHRGSEKYLYWDEALEVWEEGASVMIYQHFPRRPRQEYAHERADKLGDVATTAPWIGTVRTSHVLFLVAPQPSHATALRDGMDALDNHWDGEFSVSIVGA